VSTSRGRSSAPHDQASTLSDLVSRLVLAANRYVLGAAKVAGIGGTDLLALCYLQAGPMAAGELCERLAITSASMTVLADRLQRDGRLRRRSDPSDRRKFLLAVTPRGSREVRTVMGWLAMDVSAAAAGLSEDQRNCIERFLETIEPRIDARAQQAISPGGSPPGPPKG
jgi:DNA-binding MarR family transcriptional regulator